MSKKADNKVLKPSQMIFKSTIQKIPYAEKTNNYNNPKESNSKSNLSIIKSPLSLIQL